MKISQEGIDLIKSRESCRLKAYKCPAGVWTIGYGHTGSEVHEGLEITQAEADSLLSADLITFDAHVSNTCPVAEQHQHDAMVSLCYNIGPGNFAKSSVARLHNAEKYPEAAQAFALWNKAAGKVLPGLVSRRAAEAALYLKGTDVSLTPNGEGEKPIIMSRAINGSALTGGATVAGIAAQIPDAQDAVSQIVPYFDRARYILLALVLVGVLLTVYARFSDRREGRA